VALRSRAVAAAVAELGAADPDVLTLAGASVQNALSLVLDAPPSEAATALPSQAAQSPARVQASKRARH
jgi:hypothetical protein